jgi:hypothetical protein
MAFWNRIFNKKDGGAVAEADKEDASPSEPVSKPKPGDGAIVEDDAVPEGTGKVPKRSFLNKFESKVRRKVDSYVDNKADALLDDATRRAQQFREETIVEVHDQAMRLLDLTEERIDEKLVEIEEMLEKRLQAELKMRLRAMLWTLGFVLLMAAVSFAYVWVKRSTGLEDHKDNAAESSQPADG